MVHPTFRRDFVAVVAVVLAAVLAVPLLMTGWTPLSSSSAGAATGTAGGSLSGHPSSASTRGARTAHVMLIVFENHGYTSIIGNPTAPYLNGLAKRFGLATASYATTHPSLPNYLELVSGSTQGITTDCTTTCSANGPQVVDQLGRRGIGWRAYMEGVHGACYTGAGDYPYDRHHDPFVYAPHIVDKRTTCGRVVPFATLAPALAKGTAPPFIWVTPDVLHDMHTGSVRQGDSWLGAQLPAVLRSRWYRDGGVVIITFDESGGTTTAGCCTGAAGGHIATIVVSSRTRPGARMARPVDDAGVLRTVEALYHLPYLGAARNPRSGTLLPLLGMKAARR
jgi:hypothetical protein